MSKRLEELWYRRPGEERLSERAALSPLSFASLLYGAAVGVRNALYQGGALGALRIEGAKVVSVGNLNVGGSGKTPAVIHLARLAAGRGRKVAVLSRGYGRTATADQLYEGHGPLPLSSDFGDEPLTIARSCPGVVVMVGPDRALLAERARRELGAELILLDDGMQHRRLARDVEIVVIDEAAGFGNGQLLPRGPLREPLSSLERADLIWLRSSPAPGPALPPFTAPVVRVRHKPVALVAPDGGVHSPEMMRGKRVLALAGLARPSGFLATLAGLGMEPAATRLFADHHPFTPEELREVRAEAERLEAPIVTTDKDQARLPQGYPAWVVRLEVEILSGEEHLLARLGL
ncbi:MAG: tetraacyldisaccharide 4'-kinase [Myxococcaceae bacterium]